MDRFYPDLEGRKCLDFFSFFRNKQSKWKWLCCY
jgi:hypothetical protein